MKQQAQYHYKLQQGRGQKDVVGCPPYGGRSGGAQLRRRQVGRGTREAESSEYKGPEMGASWHVQRRAGARWLDPRTWGGGGGPSSEGRDRPGP